MASRPPEILAIGAAGMDISASAAQPLVAHDSNPGQIRCTPGGVARNVAENLARLGHGVRLLSVVGSDAFGDQLLAATQLAGVEVQDCQRLAGQASASYLSLHGPDGDMAVAVNDMDIVAQITPAWLAERAPAALRHARALLVDCNLSGAALEWVFANAGAAAVFAEPVSAFKCRRLLPWLGQVHTLKANLLELQALTGLPVQEGGEAALQRGAQWLHARGVRQLVVSLGARGAYWSARQKDVDVNAGDDTNRDSDDCTGGEMNAGAVANPVGGAGSGWQRALPVPVVNASGAGDAMMAGLLHAHLCGDALAPGVAFATGCAALTLGAPAANCAGLSVEAVRQLLAAFHLR